MDPENGTLKDCFLYKPVLFRVHVSFQCQVLKKDISRDHSPDRGALPETLP